MWVNLRTYQRHTWSAASRRSAVALCWVRGSSVSYRLVSFHFVDSFGVRPVNNTPGYIFIFTACTRNFYFIGRKHKRDTHFDKSPTYTVSKIHIGRNGQKLHVVQDGPAEKPIIRQPGIPFERQWPTANWAHPCNQLDAVVILSPPAWESAK